MKLEEHFTSFRAPGLFLPELAWNPPEEEPFLQSNRVDRVIAHLAGYDGADSQLLRTTSGALHVAGAGFDDLELALCGAGDKGLDDLDAAFTSLELALTGVGDKGLDDLYTEMHAVGWHVAYGYNSVILADIKDALESIDVILTDVYSAANHWLQVNYTS